MSSRQEVLAALSSEHLGALPQSTIGRDGGEHFGVLVWILVAAPATEGPEKPLTAGAVGLPWPGSREVCGFPQGFTPSCLISCLSKKTK